MALFDISLVLQEGAVSWPGTPGYRREWVSRREEGSTSNLSLVEMDLHSLTHIDAPLHFVEGGKTIDSLPLDLFVGECLVVEVKTEGNITGDDLAGRIPTGTRRLLIKTCNSEIVRDSSFHEDFIALLPGAVDVLLENAVELVGIDYLSLGPRGEVGTAVHRRFLAQGDRAILEGIDLSEVAPGRYRLVAPPLKLKGAEASPVRALLEEL